MHTIILISGKQGSGKSSLADNLARTFQENFSVHRTRYAKVLYLMHDAVRDIGRKFGIPFEDKLGPLLQYMGTELVRNNYGDDSWVNCVKKELNDLKTHGEASLVIIDDCRFPNEATAFENTDYDFFKIRLNADREIRKARTKGWRENDTHPSEIALDDYQGFDLVLDTGVLTEKETLEAAINAILNWAKG